jgi:hypothetical protein
MSKKEPNPEFTKSEEAISAAALAQEFEQREASEVGESAVDYPDVNFRHRLGDTLHTLFREELPEDGYRAKRLGAFVLAGTAQALDRARATVFLLPLVFDESLEKSAELGLNGAGTAGMAAATVGGAFGAWLWGVGRSFHMSLNAFPRTTEKVTENHPVMVDVISKAIDGFPEKEELKDKQPVKPPEGYNVGPYDSRKTWLGKAALAFTRSLKTTFLFGTTAHVGMAKVSEHSDESNARRRRAATAEASVALGGIAAWLSTMITHDMFGAAEQVRDTITNEAYLGSAAAFFIAAAAISNYFARRKEQKETETISGDA